MKVKTVIDAVVNETMGGRVALRCARCPAMTGS